MGDEIEKQACCELTYYMLTIDDNCLLRAISDKAHNAPSLME